MLFTLSSGPISHRRAVAFIISRMLTLDELAIPGARSVLAAMHRPLSIASVLESATSMDVAASGLQVNGSLTASEAVDVIIAFVGNADPSPDVLSSVLSPVLPELYSLWAYLDQSKASDPALKGSVNALLTTWGRIVAGDEGVRQLWSVISGAGGFWRGVDSGSIERVDV